MKELNMDDRNSVFREESMVDMLTFCKKLDPNNEILQNMEKKKDFVSKLSFEDFKSLIVRINGILRSIPKPDRGLYDKFDPNFIQRIIDHTGTETIYYPPLPTDKLILLEKAFSLMKRLFLKNKISDAVIMIGIAINTIHIFEDGNGRTARFISMVLGSSKNSLEIYGPNPHDIQPIIDTWITRIIYKLDDRNFDNIDSIHFEFAAHIPSATQNEIVKACGFDTQKIIDACRIFARYKKFDINQYIKGNTFLLSQFFGDHSDTILELFDTYRILKNTYIDTLIDIFENPNNYYIEQLTGPLNPKSELYHQFANKTLYNLCCTNIAHRTLSNREISWDYLVKFINGEA